MAAIKEIYCQNRAIKETSKASWKALCWTKTHLNRFSKKRRALLSTWKTKQEQTLTPLFICLFISTPFFHGLILLCLLLPLSPFIPPFSFLHTTPPQPPPSSPHILPIFPPHSLFLFLDGLQYLITKHKSSTPGGWERSSVGMKENLLRWTQRSVFKAWINRRLRWHHLLPYSTLWRKSVELDIKNANLAEWFYCTCTDFMIYFAKIHTGQNGYWCDHKQAEITFLQDLFLSCIQWAVYINM